MRAPGLINKGANVAERYSVAPVVDAFSKDGSGRSHRRQQGVKITPEPVKGA